MRGSFTNRLIVTWGVLVSGATFAAQRGPILPTHHYPTDRSFHLGYDFGWFQSAANFVSPLTTDALAQNSRLRIFRHSFLIEAQPNRRASIGARINLDSAQLSSPQADEPQSKTAFSDQSLFAEYRFFDEPGRSFGGAVVAKFPLYKNPTAQDIATNGGESVILLGDAQTDLSFLFTAEYWPASIVRMQLDGGFTYRTEGYSPEVPYQASVGFVTPKVDLTLRVKGNFSIKADGPDVAEDEAEVSTAFASSAYALSQSPWTLNLEPHLEIWVKPSWALSFAYTYSLAGNQAPNFQAFQIGFMYRFAERVVENKRTFKQVDIRTDQDEGRFQGEEQLKQNDPKRRRELEPRAPNPKPIPDSDEEFR